MYNKVIANTLEQQQYEEVIISLNGNDGEKVLFYRDEGNMNIVVSLFAQDNEEKSVIRFKKVPIGSKLSSDHKFELLSFVRFEELLQKYFDHFTEMPKIAYLDIDIHTLNDFLLRDRPVIRRSKIIGHNYGLLYRDVAFLPKEIYTGLPLNGEFQDSPTVCIEIKVKQGYTMNDDEFGNKKCRFCYFQYLKLKNAKISDISSYCPIDLFSGDAKRMSCAIRGLFENPQNNLKMFMNGKMVYNEYTTDKMQLKRMLKNIFPDINCSEIQETLIVNLIRKILLKDFSRCDCAIDFYNSNKDSVDKNDVHFRNCIAEPFPQLPKNCILRSILKAQHLVRDNFSQMENFENSLDDVKRMENYEQTIQDYRMGSTALDCSVMVTFRRINEANFDIERNNLIDKNHYVTFKGPNGFAQQQHFVVNATIVDLDEKKDSFAHFHKYRAQYRESIVAYEEFMKENHFVES